MKNLIDIIRESHQPIGDPDELEYILNNTDIVFDVYPMVNNASRSGEDADGFVELYFRTRMRNQSTSSHFRCLWSKDNGKINLREWEYVTDGSEENMSREERRQYTDVFVEYLSSKNSKISEKYIKGRIDDEIYKTV